MAAPKGNQFAAKSKDFESALRRALNRNDGSLNRIADKLIQKAEDGESWAVAEVANRLDGKPKQTLDAAVEANLTVKWPLAKTALDK